MFYQQPVANSMSDFEQDDVAQVDNDEEAMLIDEQPPNASLRP